MKKNYLAIILAVMLVFCLSFGAFAAEPTGEWSSNAAKDYATVVDPSGKTVTIASPEELALFANQVNSGTSYAGYTINITKKIDMSAHYWTPIDTATLDGSSGVKDPQKKLNGATIDGGNFTITGITTKTGIRGPKEDSTEGDGQYCYYYTGFIGRNDADLTISDLTFDSATVKMTEPAGVAEHGSSSLAVVAGYSKGKLTLNNVNITDSLVAGEQKCGGFVGQGAGSLEVNHCSITGSTFDAVGFAAPISGYAMHTQYDANTDGRTNTLTVNGIKLANNTVKQNESEDENYLTMANGGTYSDWYKKSCDWYLNWCDTAFIDYSKADTGKNEKGETFTYRGIPLTFAASIEDYQYDTVEAAVAAANENKETDSNGKLVPITIQLAAGEFKNVSDNEKMAITRANVTLVGAGEEKTVLDLGTTSCSGQAGLLAKADNITIKDLTVKSTANKDVSAIKFSTVGTDGELPLAVGGKIENVTVSSGKSHAVNIHGVDGMVIDGLTVSNAGKAGLSIANSPAVTLKNSTLDGNWGDVAMMYKDTAAYVKHSVLTLAGGNTFKEGTIYSERPATAKEGVDSVINVDSATWAKTVAVNGAWSYQKGTTVASITKDDKTVAYADFVSAFHDAADQDTIKLTANSTVSTTVGNQTTETNKKVTLDMNGYNLNFEKAFYLRNGQLDITGKGIIERANAGTLFVIYGSDKEIANYSVLNVGKDVTLKAATAIGIFNADYDPDRKTGPGYGVKVTVDGDVIQNDAASEAQLISTNGYLNTTSGENLPEITIGKTATITAINDTAIYAAGYAIWHLNCDITAPYALSLKSGIVDITGGSYHSTGAYKDPAETNNDGTENTGAALSLTSNDNYAEKLNVTVSGGTFTSDKGYAVYEGIAKNKETPAASKTYATLKITDGTFNGNAKLGSVKIDEMTAGTGELKPGEYQITGGTFDPALKYAFTTAPLADNAEKDPIDLKDYKYSVKDRASVLYLTAKNVPWHTNGAGTEGNWVGAGISVPQYFDIATVKGNATYSFSANDYSSDLKALGDEEFYEKDGNTYVYFYANAADKAAANKYITIDWDGAGKTFAPLQYELNLNDVSVLPAKKAGVTVTSVENYPVGEDNSYAEYASTKATLSGNEIKLTGTIPYMTKDTQFDGVSMGMPNGNRFVINLNIANVDKTNGTKVSVSNKDAADGYNHYTMKDDVLTIVYNASKDGKATVIFDKDTAKAVTYTITWANAVLSPENLQVEEEVTADFGDGIIDAIKEDLTVTKDNTTVEGVTKAAEEDIPALVDAILADNKTEVEEGASITAKTIVDMKITESDGTSKIVIKAEPKLQVTVTNDSKETVLDPVPIDNKYLAEKMTLKFALPANFITEDLEVIHEGAKATEYLQPEIISDNGILYAQVEIDSFSTFTLQSATEFKVNYLSSDSEIEITNAADLKSPLTVADFQDGYVLPAATADGHTFSYWQVAKTDGTVTPVEEITPGTINTYAHDGELSVYAVWNDAKAVVSFNSDGGTFVDAVLATVGQPIAAPTPPPTKTGYTFDAWYNGDAKYDFSTAVNENLTLTAKWNINKYTVTFDSKDGTAVPAQTVDYNAKATVPPATTKEGYTFAGWYNGDAAYNFDSAVTSNLTLTAKWNAVEVPAIVYEDLDKDHWAYNDITAMTKAGYLSGVVIDGKNYFKPGDPMSRAQFVSILSRIDKIDEEAYAEKGYSFTDIDTITKKWAGPAIAWAAEKKIVSGKSATEFAPSENISREQMAEMIANYLTYKGVTEKGDWAKVSFTDKANVGSWAQQSVATCAELKVLVGNEKGEFMPKKDMTRAEGASVLPRILKVTAK